MGREREGGREGEKRWGRKESEKMRGRREGGKEREGRKERVMHVDTPSYPVVPSSAGSMRRP